MKNLKFIKQPNIFFALANKNKNRIRLVIFKVHFFFVTDLMFVLDLLFLCYIYFDFFLVINYSIFRIKEEVYFKGKDLWVKMKIKVTKCNDITT